MKRLFLLLPVLGCGGPAAVCAAGQQISCACPSGGMGVQVCAGDGTGYDACQCGTGGAGGSAGSGGAGGSGGDVGGAGGAGSGGAAGAGGGCPEGLMVACYTGPPATMGVGPCTAGVATCGVDGTFGPCVGEVLPAAVDSCQTAADDDCSGSANDCQNTLFTQVFAPAQPVDLHVDAAGNAYVTLYGGPLDILGDSYSGGVVVKILANGTIAWAHELPGGVGYERVTVNDTGDVYIIGAFTGSTIIDGQVATADGVDMYMVHLDSQGQEVDAVALIVQGNYTNVPTAIAALPGGDVVAAGTFQGQLAFGATVLMGPAQNADTFLVRYAPDLGVVWAEAGTNFRARGLGAAPNGDILVDGFGYLTVGLGGMAIPTAGQNDFVFARLDGGGTALSGGAFGSAAGSEDQISGLAVGSNGSHFAGGYLQSTTVDFGGAPLSGGAQPTPFYVGFNDAGQHLWSATLSAPQGGGVGGMAAHPGKGAYFVGYFAGTLSFGPTSLPSAGANDAFLLQLDEAGSVVAFEAYGDADQQIFVDVGTDLTGLPIVLASVKGSIDFGMGPVSVPGGQTGALVGRIAP